MEAAGSKVSVLAVRLGHTNPPITGRSLVGLGKPDTPYAQEVHRLMGVELSQTCCQQPAPETRRHSSARRQGSPTRLPPPVGRQRADTRGSPHPLLLHLLVDLADLPPARRPTHRRNRLSSFSPLLPFAGAAAGPERQMLAGPHPPAQPSPPRPRHASPSVPQPGVAFPGGHANTSLRPQLQADGPGNQHAFQPASGHCPLLVPRKP
jgi:hypothetical protein